MNARDHMALALDIDDLDTAVGLARRLMQWFTVTKVGLELYTAAGNVAVTRLRELGFDVFLDLKLHDIPTTVGRAARVLGGLGVRYVTMHAAGGADMLRAGVDGLAEGAAAAGHPPPVALGVTVLTSDQNVSRFDSRLEAAVAGGCGGVVCSALELVAVKHRHPSLVAVVPGIRLGGWPTHDQVRVGEPGDVIRRGGDLLVIGRSVTEAPFPEDWAAAISAAIDDATRA